VQKFDNIHALLSGFTLVLSVLSGFAAQAQETVETTISTDVVSSYIWRGQDLGSAAVQPTLGIDYKGLSLSAWGSYGLVNTADTKEFDLTLSYTIGGLNIGMTDYWFDRGGRDPENRYFKYDAHGTNHVFEATVGYDFGVASVQWSTNFSGNDYKADGKRAYSSYVEVAVPFRLATVDWTATAGVVPWATTSYGTNGFAVTNLALKATKEIKVTDTFSIPVFGQVVGNPCSQNAYLVFGFTLQP
jgi:hypothetical protein